MGPVYGQPPCHHVVPEGNHGPDLIAEYTHARAYSVLVLAAIEPEIVVDHFVGIRKHLEHVVATTGEQVPLNSGSVATNVGGQCNWTRSLSSLLQVVAEGVGSRAFARLFPSKRVKLQM